MSFAPYIDRNGTQVVLLPDSFAGHSALRPVARGVANELTSETPEPIAFWREKLTADDDTRQRAFNLYVEYAQDLAEPATRNRIVKDAANAAAALRELRVLLDHLRAREGNDPRVVALWRKYDALATAVYGHATPLNPETREPVFPKGFEEAPAMEGVPTAESCNAHEPDGVIFGQALAFAHEFGDAFTASFGGAQPEMFSGPVALWFVVGSMGLSPIGVAYVHDAKGTIKAAVREAKSLVGRAGSSRAAM